MLQIRIKNYQIRCIFLSFLSTIPLCIPISLSKILASTNENNIIIQNFTPRLSITIVLLCIAFMRWGWKLEEVNRNYSVIQQLVYFQLYSFILALLWIFSDIFRENQLNFRVSIRTVGVLLIYCAGYYYLIFNCLCSFSALLSASSNHDSRTTKTKRHIASISPRCVLFYLLCIWGIHLIVCFPANICYDAWVQLAQFWNILPFSSHHAPMHTVFIGLFSKLGNYFGSAGNGLFLFVCIQTMLFLFIIMHTIKLMEDITAPQWLIYTTLLTVFFSPYYTNRVNVILKDSLYSIFFLLMIAEIIYALIDLRAFVLSISHIILSCIAVFMVLCLRNNGRHVWYPTMLAFACLLFFHRARFDKKIIMRALLLLIFPGIIAFTLETSLIKAYHIQKGSFREALSLPFQQTARFLKYYPQDVLPEEHNIINTVLQVDKIGSKYNPRIADPVKNLYKINVRPSDLVKYLYIWGKHFLRHPLTYFAATFHQNYYIIYPFQENDKLYKDFFIKMRPCDILKTKLHMKDRPHFLEKPREALFAFDHALFRLPIIGLLSHPAFYVLVFIALVMFSLLQKHYLFLLPTIPVFLSILVIIFAPVIQGHPRYAFPIIYSTPVLVAYYCYLCRK